MNKLTDLTTSEMKKFGLRCGSPWMAHQAC